MLVRNAGLLSPRLTRTDAGVERTMAVNALAPFVLTNALRPLLEQTADTWGDARVVTVSSEAQSRRLPTADPAALADALRARPTRRATRPSRHTAGPSWSRRRGRWSWRGASTAAA